MELQTISFIESKGVACSDSVGRNIVEITKKMKTIVQKPLMIKITKLLLRNLDDYYTN